jgi:glycosyltransferase involved in cell wall biosynthesis
MPPLRVLHVTPYAGEVWAYGGIPRVVSTLTRGLARRGHRVTVCATDVCDNLSRLGWRELVTPDGVTVRIFPNISNRLAYHAQLYLPVGFGHYLRRHAKAFDVAHLHACRNMPGTVAAWHLRRAKVPYVLGPNGTAGVIERHRLAKRVYDAVLGHGVIAGASAVLAVSDAEQRQLCALGIDRSAIRMVSNPIDLDEFKANRSQREFRRQHGLSNDLMVLFLGQLTPRKRVDVLVRAFARVGRSDTQLVLAGNDRGASRSVRSVVASLGLESRTVFTGLLRGDERLEALAEADVVVYASEHEVFGLVALEALLCGTPVIVAGDSGCGEVIRASGGGQIVPVGDVDALARAIEAVLEDRSAWRAQAACASTRVRATYNEARVCGELEGVYREVMAT